MRGRLLPRLDAYGLGEHVKGYGLLPRSELAIAAKTMHILQKFLLPLASPILTNIEINTVLLTSLGTSMQDDSRVTYGRFGMRRTWREPSCALGRGVWTRALWGDECKSKKSSSSARV